MTVQILKKEILIRASVDPCPYKRKSGKGVMVITFYMDDDLLIGNPDVMEEAIELFQQNGLILKVEEDLHDGHEIKFSDDKKKAWIGQPYLMKCLRK